MSEACASAAAITTRCFSPPLSVLNGRRSRPRGPGRGQDFPRDRQIVRSLHFEEAEMRMPAHEHHVEHRVLERELRLLRHDGDSASDLAACHPIDRPVLEQDTPGRRAGACRSAAAAALTCRIRSGPGCRRCCRARSSIRRPGRAPGRAFARVVRERDLIGLQQSALLHTRCGPAPDSRAPPRSGDRRDSARARRRQRRARGGTSRQGPRQRAPDSRTGRRDGPNAGSASSVAPRAISDPKIVTRGPCPGRVERALMARAAQKRISDEKWCRRLSGGRRRASISVSRNV